MGYFIKADPHVHIYIEDINPTGKKTIFFIHGWPVNHKIFEYQYNQLPQKGYRCIGMDIRGFGLSSKPWDGYDYNRLSDDLRAVIDVLNLKKIILCGHSTGGAIAVRYMARHSGYGVSKLALLAAAAPSLIQRPYFEYGLPKQRVLDIIKQTYQNRPDMLKEFGNSIFHHYVTPAISDWVFNLGMEASNRATAAVANTWLGEESLFDDLTAIKTPTLILHGYDDKICPFALALAQKKRISHAKLVPLQSCGHFLFYDQLNQFNSELCKFIEE